MQDLAALSKILDKTASSADALDKAFARTAASTNVNLTKAAKSMEKYAQVAALLSKIKIAGNPVGQIQEMAKALDAVGRARTISDKNVVTIRELGAALQTLRAPERMLGVSALLNSLGRAKIPTQAQTRNLREFFGAISTFKGASSNSQLDRLLATIGALKAPNAGTIKRIEQMFGVLSSAKEIPNAGKIARDLDMIAAAATRASRALHSMPTGSRGLAIGGTRGGSGGGSGIGGGARASAAGARALGGELAEAERSANRARSSFSLLGAGLGDLSGRFHLSYQAGTLLSTMFASFTLGQFVRSVYDANIQLLKLQKAVLFSTGSFDGAAAATDKYISMSQELGLSIKDNIETYGRFVIASKASNISLDETNTIYKSLGTALTVVGASAQQQQLAFYGLTEMLQKGVVYSKEFNRQIGAQLPGNAILGARALSVLEGHVVSVAEFFQRMHSGTLLSPQFVPEWAKQIDAMYHPLLALAQARPDVAITRLSNSFFVFAREVGSGKFMSAIGNEITALMNKFVTLDKDGIAHLTPQAKKLADTLGEGLSTAIHGLGTALGFIIDHFDTLLTLFKGFIGYELSKEILKIAAAADVASVKFVQWGAASARAAFTNKAASTANAAAIAVGTTVSSVSAVAREPEQLSLALGEPGEVQGSLPLYMPQQRRAATNLLAGTGAAPWRRIDGGVGEGYRTLGASRSMPSVSRMAASVGGAAMSGLSAIIGNLGPIAMGATVALALFGDKMSGIKSAGGQDVTYNDIAGGTFDTIGDSISGTLKSVGQAFGLFGNNTLTFGKIIIFVAATVKSVFDLLFDLAHAIGAAIGTAISNVITVAMTLGKVISDIFHGDFLSAWKDIKGGAQGLYQNTAHGLGTIGGDLVKIGTTDSLSGNYARISQAAGSSADSRNQKTRENESQQRQLEAALRQQAAASIIENAAQTFAEATLGMNQLTQKIDPAQLLANIKAFGAGSNTAAGLTPGQIAAAGPGANVGLRNIIDDAAKKAGVDPQLLFNLGLSETHYDPNQYGFNRKGGTSARGPFQLESGALTDLSRAGYDVSGDKAYHLDTSAPLAAAYLKMAQEQFRHSAGRDLLPYEALLPYKLGGGGAGSLVKAMDQNPSQLVTAIPALRAAVASPGNHSLFYAGHSGDNSTPLTAQETYAKLVSMAGGSTPHQNGEAPDVTGLAPGQSAGGPNVDNKINTTADIAYKQVMAMIGEASPASAALATYQEKLVSLQQTFQKVQQDQAKNPWSKTFFSDKDILSGISRAMDRLQQKLDEAQDPIKNMNRLQGQANDITALRVRGLGDEADYQSEVNKLVEQGYLRTEVDNKANHDAFLAGKDRERTLTAQIDLTKTLLELEVRRMTRQSNNPVQNLVNQGIQTAALPGEDFATARARLTRTGQLGTITQGAQATYADTNDTARQTMRESIGELQSTYALNPTAKSLRDDYKKALQDMTGLSTDSLARLNAAASDSDKAFASNYASLKYQLENPPGFQRWVNGLEPFEKRLEDIKYTFAQDLSNNLTSALSGEKVDWSGMFKDMRKQMVQGGVDQLLSSAFGALGLTKPQTPEEAMTAASSTFATGADTFATSVMMFASSVGGGSAAAAAGSSVSTLSSDISGLRGSIYDDTSGITPVSVTPMRTMADALASAATSAGANDNYVPQTIDVTPMRTMADAISSAASNDSSSNAASASPFGSLMDSIGSLFGGSSDSSSGPIAPVSVTPMRTMAQSMASMGPLANATTSGSSFASSLNNWTGGNGSLLLGGLGAASSLIEGLFDGKPKPTYHMPSGIIGSPSTNTVHATNVAGHENPIGAILGLLTQGAMSKANAGATSGSSNLGQYMNTFMNNLGNNVSSDASSAWDSVSSWGSSAMDSIGSGASDAMSGMGDMFSSLFSFFSEGGYSTQPLTTKVLSARSFNDIPHYAEGTGNTSGGIPAMLHPNEAVIPLSRGRKIPVDLGDSGGGSGPVVNSNITVISPNADSFRKSSGAIKRDQNRSLRRAASRNLTGAN